jgi:2-phosphosulfolactate phosphatase
VNGRATVEHVIRQHPGRTLLIVCSGSVSNMNVEDLYGAGYLVELLSAQLGNEADLSDAARVAHALYRNAAPEESLLGSRVGRMASRRGDEAEVRHAAQLSVFDLVAQLKDGIIARLKPGEAT